MAIIFVKKTIFLKLILFDHWYPSTSFLLLESILRSSKFDFKADAYFETTSTSCENYLG